MSDLKEGRTLGPWTLISELGEGGNAEVWLCKDSNDRQTAVKFLKTRKVESAAWKRFSREVTFVQQLEDRPGVLPVLLSYVPDLIPSGKRAWYSMPVAQEMREALGEADLTSVVEAIADVAQTLADLNAEFGAAHRDIKPNNLHRHGGRWVIGDFGLLWVADTEALTASDEVAGAFSFTAPELFARGLDDGEVDYSRADTFSLAKTLWALATGERYAMPGEHDAQRPNMSVGRVKPHPRARALNQLLQRATTIADDRISMSVFASELRAWLELSQARSSAPDLSGLAQQIREQQEPVLAQAAARERAVDFGRSAVRELRVGLEPLFSQLDGFPGSQTHVDDQQMKLQLQSHDFEGSPTIWLRESICARVSDQSEALAYILRLGALVEVIEPDRVRVGAAFELGYEKVMQAAHNQLTPREVEAGSVAQDELVGEVIEWLNANAESWLQKFAEDRSS